MSTFLTILILFFVVTAIWQIVKIYDLTQVNTVAKDSSQIANDKDNKVCLLYTSPSPRDRG